MIVTETGAEVYIDQIDRIVQEFLESMEDGEEVDIYSFRLLLRRIYTEVFRPSENRQHNTRTALNLENVALLDQLWDCYVELCCLCKINPTIQRFGLMVGISPETLCNWGSQRTRGGNTEYFLSYQKWKQECESSLADLVISKNSIGAIFTLKSCYDWRESAPVVQEGYISQVQSTPEEIAERYKDAKKPEIPQLD